ncbi:MAG: hypothetical protein LBL47_03235, partial [Lactobacillus sp.]|nr:hypothetical protein [Lactobacillus sp.]
EYKDGSFYNPNNATLYSAAVNIPRHAFSTEIEKLPEAQKQSEAQNLNDASGNSLGATGQALYALRALEKFGNDGQTRTEAVQHGGMITVFDPDSMKDGIYQDMKHYDKQPNGAYAEITHEEFLANAKGKQSSPAEVKIYNDEKGHFAVKTKDGPIHLNANTGKQYSQEQLGQLSTNKALGDYKQAGQQVVQSMSAERRQ